MPIEWNFGFSLMTAVVAVIALIQTKQQIKLSNKQFLFNIRVKHYRLSKELIQLYEINKEKLTMIFINNYNNDEFLWAIDSVFDGLTDIDYLEQIKLVISHPLEEPYFKDFWLKTKDMKNVSTEIKFIFSGKVAVYLGDYVLCYQQLLSEMCHFKVLLKNRTTKKLDEEKEDVKQKDMGKEIQIKELQKALKDLKQAYDNIKKQRVVEKIEKEIKLY